MDLEIERSTFENPEKTHDGATIIASYVSHIGFFKLEIIPQFEHGQSQVEVVSLSCLDVSSSLKFEDFFLIDGQHLGDSESGVFFSENSSQPNFRKIINIDPNTSNAVSCDHDEVAIRLGLNPKEIAYVKLDIFCNRECGKVSELIIAVQEGLGDVEFKKNLRGLVKAFGITEFMPKNSIHKLTKRGILKDSTNAEPTRSSAWLMPLLNSLRIPAV